MREAVKMLPSSKLLIVVLVTQCAYANGFSLFGKRTSSDGAHVIDLTPKSVDVSTDLSRLLLVPEKGLNEGQLAKRLAEQKFVGVASANNPIASLTYNDNSNFGDMLPANFYWNSKGIPVPQYRSSSALTLNGHQTAGKRLPSDNSVSASNGRLSGDRFSIAQEQTLLDQEARKNERRKYSQRNLAMNMRLEGEQQGQEQQRVLSRRSWDTSGGYIGDGLRKGGRDEAIGGRRHRVRSDGITSPRAIVDAGVRQESRKRPARRFGPNQPAASRSGPSTASKGDDIFDDDDGDASSAPQSSDTRRSSDGDEDDEADELDDEPQSDAGSAGGRKVRGHKLSGSSSSRQRSSLMDGPDDNRISGQSSDDEDFDSSNEQANLSNLYGAYAGKNGARRSMAAAADIANSAEAYDDLAAAAEQTDADENQAASQQQGHVSQSSKDLQVAAGHHHGHHGHYYQYVEVPKKKAWKFGFKRGNHKHESE